jgi:hypothetical protein
MACKCNVGLSNTGTECTPLMAVARQYVIVPKFKADGTLNKIDLTATLDSAYWTLPIGRHKLMRWHLRDGIHFREFRM